MKNLTEDEFSAWRDNEITQAFFMWIEQTVHESEAAWGQMLNGGGELELQRARLSERARLATEIINVSIEDLADEQQPERSESDRVQSFSSTR